MTLEEILNQACYSLHLKSESKPAVIGELVGLVDDMKQALLQATTPTTDK